MSKRPRRNHSPLFKAKVAVDHAYDSVGQAKAGIARYINFYNRASCYPTRQCA